MNEVSLNPFSMLLLGLVVGIGASFTGLGGGFLVVPLLIMLGFTAQKAVGTSFAAILVISVSALFAHARLEHVDFRVGVMLGLGGLIGAQVGSRLLVHVSGPVFNKIFALVLVLLAIRVFLQKS